MEKLWDPCPFLLLSSTIPNPFGPPVAPPVSSPFRLACSSVAVPDAGRCSVGRCPVPSSRASTYSGTAAPAVAPR